LIHFELLKIATRILPVFAMKPAASGKSSLGFYPEMAFSKPNIVAKLPVVVVFFHITTLTNIIATYIFKG
jgi:hypothetical protein